MFPILRLTGGIERLLIDYQAQVFSDYDVYYLRYQAGQVAELLHYGKRVAGRVTTAGLLKLSFQFILFFNHDADHQEDDFIRPLRERLPSFCFIQYHPVTGLRDKLFRGILTHHSSRQHNHVLVIGGSFDSQVFYKNRQSEQLIVCIARITPYKGQLELVRTYKKRIYDRFGLPLYLVGGTYHLDCFRKVNKYIDNQSVHSTIDPRKPLAAANWWNSRQIAAICNRARLFVMPSPEESFCVALIEAMACGTTCVVNGAYHGFKAAQLRPYVYGNIDGKRGSTLALVEEALRQEIRIDASEWVKRYSLSETKAAVLLFIRERL